MEFVNNFAITNWIIDGGDYVANFSDKVVEVNFVDINAGVVENFVVNFVKINVVEINAGVVCNFVVNGFENFGIFFDNFFES